MTGVIGFPWFIIGWLWFISGGATILYGAIMLWDKDRKEAARWVIAGILLPIGALWLAAKLVRIATKPSSPADPYSDGPSDPFPEEVKLPDGSTLWMPRNMPDEILDLYLPKGWTRESPN
jgi:hypothetical protein